MRHWFKDASFRGMMKNTGYLAGSRVITAAAGLLTLALAGRSLGVAMFGLLVLIDSYAQSASNIIRFQSWQLVVRYGSPAIASGNPAGFKEAVGFAFALDVVSGIGGMLLAMALLPMLAPWFHIPDEYVGLALVYCLLMPTMAAAAPIGVLRALDRFDILSGQGVVTPVMRSALTVMAWTLGLGFFWFVAIWFITDLVGDLVIWWLAARELRRRNLLKGTRPTLRARGLEGGWKFALSVNATGSLSTAWGPVANLLVGGLLGPVSAGLYRISQTLVDSAGKPADMLAKVFYPEVVRLDLKTGHPWRLMLRAAALTGGAALLFAVAIAIGGRPLISAVFGHDFAPAYPILMVMIIALFMTTIAFPLAPMLYALDKPTAPLIARSVGVLVYFASIIPLTRKWDVIGAAAAYVIGNAFVLLIMISHVYRQYLKLRRS